MTRALSAVNKKLREENLSLRDRIQYEEDRFDETLLQIRELRKEKEYWKQIAKDLGFIEINSEVRPSFCSPRISKSELDNSENSNCEEGESVAGGGGPVAVVDGGGGGGGVGGVGVGEDILLEFSNF